MTLMFGSYLAAAGTSAQTLESIPMMGALVLANVVIAIRLAAEAGVARNVYLTSSACAVALLLVVHEPKNSALSWFFSHVRGVKTLASQVELWSGEEMSPGAPLLAANVPPDIFARFPRAWSLKQMQALEMFASAGVQHEDAIFLAADTSPAVMFSGTRYAASNTAWWPGIWVDAPESMKLIDPELLYDADYILRDDAGKMYWRYLMHHREDYFRREFREVSKRGDWTLYARRTARQAGNRVE
jgi:hypothetical protein